MEATTTQSSVKRSQPVRPNAGESPSERSHHRRAALFGESMVWLCGGALALNLLLVGGLLVLLAVNGLGYFWPSAVVKFELTDGRKFLGEIHQTRVIPPPRSAPRDAVKIQTQVKIGNRDFTGNDFVWIDDQTLIRSTSTPAGVVVLERLEYGSFFGHIVEVKIGGQPVAKGSDAAWKEFLKLHSNEAAERGRVIQFERDELGPVNQELNRLRLEKKRIQRTAGSADEKNSQLSEVDRLESLRVAESQRLADRLVGMRKELLSKTIVMEAVNGDRKELPVSSVVRAIQPNNLGFWGALGVYMSRAWEFVADDPRESNTEGGIFPAIFGTVLMVLLMSIAVVPLGVLAALYLREYAKPGPLVRIVRIAVNNLAGVPSIVFGVFGLGFFVYWVGGSIDHFFFQDALPTPTFGTGGILWAALTLALLTVPVVIVATEEGLAAVPRIVREGSRAMGATKFETTWRVVIPAAAPGILTGLILAMARAAGEVAPLMIVGMVKLAPALPVDTEFPFVHFERKFMHLGFHIYDVGFQSPNVDATKPLVFATAFLLIVIITVMNLMAIGLRNNLRRRYAGSAV